MDKTNRYVTPFLAHGIDISPEDQDILNRWYETCPAPVGFGVPKLMTFDEAMEYEGFIQDIFSGFPGGESVALWDTEGKSAFVGYYYTGPLKGTVYLLQGPTDVSPKFLSLARFYDYFLRILREYTEDGSPDYDTKFWRDIDFNDNQPMTEEETERFHQAAQEMMKAWKKENRQEEWYENLCFCVIAVLPNCYAGELIPFIQPKEDEYVLEALCHKLVEARCVEAVPSMEKLAKAEEKGLRIGGWSDSRTARNTYASLLEVKLTHIIDIIKKNEQLFLENAEQLMDEEVDPEDYDEYLSIQGATEEELSEFERQFQIKLPEDFKAVYKYKNGSGYMDLIWPREGFSQGYRLLSLQEMSRIKTYFQDEDCEMEEYPEVIDDKKRQQLDPRIKPHLFCKRWFPFAESAGSLYLMLDYDPSDTGKTGQVICYVHDPDFIYYVSSDITEALKRTGSVMQELVL